MAISLNDWATVTVNPVTEVAVQITVGFSRVQIHNNSGSVLYVRKAPGVTDGQVPIDDASSWDMPYRSGGQVVMGAGVPSWWLITESTTGPVLVLPFA